MTLQEAKSIARHLGLTLRKVRSGDYRVNFRDGNETTAYYTDSLEEAVNAAVDGPQARIVGPAEARPSLQTITMLKTLIIATVLLPMLAFAQQSQQLPQPRQPGQWCPVGWVASGSYCVPGSDKAPQAVPKNGWCPSGWRESGSYCIR
jgi:hypothetical protein